MPVFLALVPITPPQPKADSVAVSPRTRVCIITRGWAWS